MEWVRNRDAPLRAAVLTLALVAVLVWLVLLPGNPQPTDTLSLVVWWMLIVGLLLFVLSMPLLVPVALAADQDGLHVRWPLRSRNFPWTDIGEIIASEIGGLGRLWLGQPSYTLTLNMPDLRAKAVRPVDALVVNDLEASARAQGTPFKILRRTKPG